MAESPGRFRLDVLGPPEFRDQAGLTPPGLGWGKPLALLCLLAVRHEVARDEVVDLLWRDVPEDKARNAFRQALHRLRSAVGDELLPQDRERLRLIPSDSLAVDLDRAEAAANAGRLDDAVALFRGDFLAGHSLGEAPFDLWIEHERARLNARRRQLLSQAIERASAEGRWVDAIRYAEQLIAAAPFETDAARLAATTLIAAGRRTEARDLLLRFGATLTSELGIALPADLQAMLGRMERIEPRAEPSASGSREIQLPFVGREEELSRLVTLCRSAHDDHGVYALIEGPAGIGKTRLVRELDAHLRSLGRITVLSGREHPVGTLLPYAVFAEAFQPLVRASGIVGASKHLLAEAARLLPALRDEIDLPAVADVEDDAARLRFFEGIAALVDAAAFERAIVILLEDLQFLAPSSLELLSYLCVRLARSPVAFVITVRPDDAPHATIGRLRAFASQESSTHAGRNHWVVLSPLSADAARNAAGAVAARLSVSDAVLDRVLRHGAGVPAKLVDALRRAASGDPLSAAPVAAKEAATDRLARISSAARRVVFVLAIIGRPVPVHVVSAAAHLTQDQSGSLLDELAREGLLEREGDRVAVASAVASAALEAAGSQTRSFLSAWAADALGATASASAAELARLHAAAGATRLAFENYRRAAFSSLAVGAITEATAFLQAARTFAGGVEEHQEIESLLTAVGSGRVRIPTDTPPGVAQTPQVHMDEPVRSRASGTTDVGAGWQRLFPNWRLLLGAALATLVITTIVLARRDTALAPAATVFPGDTLVIADGDDPRIVRYAIPNGSGGLQLLERTLALPSIPSWVDSLAAAWTHRVPSPTGDRVALAHVTPSGTDVLIVSSSRRDTLVLIAGTGEARPFDWSPDGRSLLVGVTQGAGEGLDLDLVVFRDRGDAFVRAPIDTVPQRSVVEAAWSPDGSRIAWVARVGQQRQLEVFVGNADGSGARNVSRHPADDQHISWSPNGELLAFTSGRDGNAELYAMAFREERLWRLTFDDAQDDAGRFSTDGRLIAFESTRGGASGVYVMPALGGEPARLDLSGNVSVRGWRGLRSRFVDRVTVSSLSAGGVGDTMVLAVRLRDQFREDLPSRSVDWRVMDSAIARPVSALSGETLRVVGRAGGLARVVADVGKWRSDTAFLRVGDVSLVLLSDQEGARAWRLIGDPLPTVAGGSIVLRSDRRWDSGVLSRALLPLLPGLEVVASIDVPTGSTDPAATLGIALVAPEDSSLIEISAPQFLRYASFVWSAEASRFVYSANREVFSEPAPPAVAGPMTIRLRIESDSTLSVAVGERQRWRSTIRVVGPQSSRARLWISSRGTGSGVRLHNASVVLGSVQRGNTN